MSGSPADSPPDVTDVESAFMTLSHDLRLKILLALWNAPGFSLSFAELRKAVGERDSGTFNYHLTELEGHFVTATDDGYELQYPGHRVLDAIQSGVFHDKAIIDPIKLDEHCLECGEKLAFEYNTDYIGRIHCPGCENRVLEWPFDPGGTVNRDPTAVVEAFDRRTRLIWSCALNGICPFCAGRIDREFANHLDEHGICVGVIEQLDRYDEYFARDHPVVVFVDCDRCSFYSFIPAGVVLLIHPKVMGTLYDAGLNVRDTPLWGFTFVVDSDAISLRSTDSVRIEIGIPDIDEPLTYVVDESFAVSAESDT